MIRGLSVSALLKFVISALAVAVVVVLALGAWDSGSRVAATNRIAAVADVSSPLFTALHNLRIDRASSFRDLNADKQLTALNPQLRDARAAEVPALQAALAALRSVDLPDRDAVIAGLDQAVKKLVALHEESAPAMLRPKAERRPGIAQDMFNTANGLLETLDKLSSRLTRSVKLEDAFIDELLELKQLAWIVRNAGGDASVMISNTLGGQPLPADAFVKYTSHVSKLETAWAALEELAAGLPLPARFTEAVEKTKREFFAPDFVALRANNLKALIAGEKINYTPEQWALVTVPKLAIVLGVAEAALDVAKEHAAQQNAAALRKLALELSLLVAAVAFAGGMMLMVSRRVTGPLGMLQEAMLKLAGGDLTAEVSFAGRKDEIGALASAMSVFKGNMVEADRLRTEQKEVETRAAALRRGEMQRLADEFQKAVGNIVAQVSTSSSELEVAAGTLTKNAETTQRLSGVVASASEEASAQAA